MEEVNLERRGIFLAICLCIVIWLTFMTSADARTSSMDDVTAAPQQPAAAPAVME